MKALIRLIRRAAIVVAVTAAVSSAGILATAVAAFAIDSSKEYSDLRLKKKVRVAGAPLRCR